MDAAEALSKLVQASRETAGLQLEEHGKVPPFALTLSPDGQDVRGMFPVDDHPDAPTAELLELVVQHIQATASAGKIAAAALVMQVAAGQGEAIGTQVATRSEARTHLYPYRKGATGWQIDPAEPSDRLLVQAPLL